MHTLIQRSAVTDDWVVDVSCTLNLINNSNFYYTQMQGSNSQKSWDETTVAAGATLWSEAAAISATSRECGETNYTYALTSGDPALFEGRNNIFSFKIHIEKCEIIGQWFPALFCLTNQHSTIRLTPSSTPPIMFQMCWFQTERYLTIKDNYDEQLI